MMWEKLKAPVGMGTCRDVCIMIEIVGVKIAIGREVTVSIPSGLKGSFNSLAAGRASRAADGGCFLGVLCQETVAGVMRQPAAIIPQHP